jgi:hypothetical protein
MKDLYPTTRGGSRRPTRDVSAGAKNVTRKTSYPIQDARGHVVAEHVRIDFSDGTKNMLWRRNGRHGLGGLKVADLPLYGLPELSTSPSTKRVIVVEGEKARDARARKGFLHHDFELALLVAFAVPLWPERDECAIEFDADAPAHADDHRVTVQRGEPVLEVLDQIAGNELDPMPGADDRFELGPLCLELLLTLDLFSLGRLLEVWVDMRPLGLAQGELRQSALLVDRDRRAVDH